MSTRHRASAGTNAPGGLLMFSDDLIAIQERLRDIASSCLAASRSCDPRVIAAAFEELARATRDLEDARAALERGIE